MFELLFGVLLVVFALRLFAIGIRAYWGLFRLLCSAVIFPVFLAAMAICGLIYIAFPILIVAGIIVIVMRLVSAQ